MPLDAETDAVVERLDPEMFQGPAEAYAFIDSVLEASTEYSIIATDLQGAILLWNEGARRLYGYEPREILGRHKSVLHTEDDARAGLPGVMMAQASADGKWEGTIDRVRKDGSSFRARVVMTLRCGGDGKPIGFLLMSSDIRNELRLTAERDQLQSTRSVLESAPDAMVIVDQNGEIQLANAATETMFGYRSDELVGSPVDMLIPQRYRAHHPGHRTGFFTAPRARAMGAGLELAGRRKDGAEFPVEISLSPMETDDGQFAIAAIRDVTDRQRSEQHLRETNVKLQAASLATEKANLAKSEFLSRMSHELRTPLNAILGFGQLLERSPLEDREHRHVEYILKGGRHLLELIDEVLDISRIESGSLGVSVEPVLLSHGVEEALDLVGPIADQRGISIVTDLGAVAGVWVTADLQRLKQVLLNLLSNAIKYNRPNGSIRISVVMDGEAVVLRVSDTGPGIAAADLPRLFVPFDRLGAEASGVEGTGLGLALSRRLAEGMGGTLGATSELGAGSTFELRLACGVAPVAAVARPAPGTVSVGPLRVLYVEDNVSNLRLIEEVFAGEGVEIIAAATGRLALDLAPGARADLVMLDNHLPDMAGEDVLEGLRECPQTATTPVIILTADATSGTRRRMLELGVSAHPNKPIDIDLLKSTLAEASVGIAARRRDTAADERDTAADERGTTAGRRDTTADERDTAADERGSAAGRRDTAADERDTTADRRDTVADERGSAARRRDTTADERDTTADERGSAARRRETAADERDTTADERDIAADERDTAADERDTAARAEGRRDSATRERDGAARRRETAAEARHAAADAHDQGEHGGAARRREAAAEARDTASGERDGATGERGGAAQRRDTATEERDCAARKRDDAADQRDSAADERGTATQRRDSATDERGTAAERRGCAAGERDRATEGRHG